MLTESTKSLLKKLKPVTFEQLGKYRFMLFGSGGFAKRIYKEYKKCIVGLIEYENALLNAKPSHFESIWFLPEQASGTVLLGTGNGTFQFNQLCALSEQAADRIDEILVVDPYLSLRGFQFSSLDKNILLFEHADGVVRHGKHLSKLKKYFSRRGFNTLSICPLMLLYYRDFLKCENLLIFNGQRKLYDIVFDSFPNKKLTYIEYGFFPQSEYYYFDKKGVNHRCSLMNDSLDWIDKHHLLELEKIKSFFLKDFKSVALDYILVPLQVPDDANILNCSRFTNGMQEFIDYIDSEYSARERVVFKPHPKDPYQHQYDYRGREVSELPFLTLLKHAKSVHGITSSTLYEAALAGVDVISEGTSVLNQHIDQKDKLLAAMVERQIHVENSDPRYWLDKYSHIDLTIC
ncbi:hypothetical protein GCM10009092_33960 [Bowmanella denitrificans]|uniref:Capsule polysaccharide biosynthesis protein n=1 Tax=Bowmanella denitrificans TaxID=366582 RepID=A0ABN0XL51_9ALTE